MRIDNTRIENVSLKSEVKLRWHGSIEESQLKHAEMRGEVEANVMDISHEDRVRCSPLFPTGQAVGDPARLKYETRTVGKLLPSTNCGDGA